MKEFLNSRKNPRWPNILHSLDNFILTAMFDLRIHETFYDKRSSRKCIGTRYNEREIINTVIDKCCKIYFYRFSCMYNCQCLVRLLFSRSTQWRHGISLDEFDFCFNWENSRESCIRWCYRREWREKISYFLFFHPYVFCLIFVYLGTQILRLNVQMFCARKIGIYFCFFLWFLWWDFFSSISRIVFFSSL